jgi:hypothetical protein
MAMRNGIHNASDNLIQLLAGLRYMVDANKDILADRPVSNEFLGFKIDIAQNFIDELQLWEDVGNQSKCNEVIENARFFIEQAQVLLDRILDEQCEQAWLDFQRELRFTSHDSTNYGYVLMYTAKSPSGSVAG